MLLRSLLSKLSPPVVARRFATNSRHFFHTTVFVPKTAFSPNKDRQKQYASALSSSQTIPTLTSSNFTNTVATLSQASIEGSRLPSRLFATPSHVEGLSHLIECTRQLTTLNLSGQNGTTSSSLLGAKGTGKTTVLQSFVELSPVWYPNLLPVYISFAHPKTKSVPLAETLCELLRKEHGLQLQSNDIDDLLVLLSKMQLRLLLVVDELDVLYREVPGSENGKAAYQTLNQLVYIGTQDSGCMWTVVCGGSPLLYRLISLRLDDMLRSIYPLSVGAPDLNNTKYTPFRLPSSLPNDLDAVASILTPSGQSSDNREVWRLTAFMVGTTSRKVQLFAQNKNIKNAYSIGGLAENEAINDIPGMEAFVNRILDELSTTNSQFFSQFAPDGRLDFEAVKSLEWESQTFRPVAYQRIVEIFGEVQTAGQLRHIDSVSVVLSTACENSYLVAHEGGQLIYPFCFSQVAKRRMTAPQVEQARSYLHSTVMPHIRRIPFRSCARNRNEGY
jgi:hypothetical protein